MIAFGYFIVSLVSQRFPLFVQGKQLPFAVIQWLFAPPLFPKETFQHLVKLLILPQSPDIVKSKAL